MVPIDVRMVRWITKRLWKSLSALMLIVALPSIPDGLVAWKEFIVPLWEQGRIQFLLAMPIAWWLGWMNGRVFPTGG